VGEKWSTRRKWTEDPHSILIDDVKIPFEFRYIQAAKLIDWQETSPNLSFDLLLNSVGRKSRPRRANFRMPMSPRSDQSPRKSNKPANKLSNWKTKRLWMPRRWVLLIANSIRVHTSPPPSKSNWTKLSRPASILVKTTIFNQAEKIRRENWSLDETKEIMERTIPNFPSLDRKR